MSKYLLCCEIYEEIILEIKKHGVKTIPMRVKWILDIKNAAYELPSNFAKVGAPQEDNDSNRPPDNFRKNDLLVKSFVLNILSIYRKLLS